MGTTGRRKRGWRCPHFQSSVSAGQKGEAGKSLAFEGELKEDGGVITPFSLDVGQDALPERVSGV